MVHYETCDHEFQHTFRYMYMSEELFYIYILTVKHHLITIYKSSVACDQHLTYFMQHSRHTNLIFIKEIMCVAKAGRVKCPWTSNTLSVECSGNCIHLHDGMHT